MPNFYFATLNTLLSTLAYISLHLSAFFKVIEILIEVKDFNDFKSVENLI